MCYDHCNNFLLSWLELFQCHILENDTEASGTQIGVGAPQVARDRVTNWSRDILLPEYLRYIISQNGKVRS